ncbi:MAG: hypothetical protein HOE90_01600 [Bacteriovoracaceae bacterium]|nr:hypothetical protein [Bacteriovoracaceae bacterium]
MKISALTTFFIIFSSMSYAHGQCEEGDSSVKSCKFISRLPSCSHPSNQGNCFNVNSKVGLNIPASLPRRVQKVVTNHGMKKTSDKRGRYCLSGISPPIA